jgi:hypothetical protein
MQGGKSIGREDHPRWIGPVLAALSLCAVGTAHGLPQGAEQIVHRPVAQQVAAIDAVRKAGRCTRAAQDAVGRFGRASSAPGRQPAVSRSRPLRMILM